MIDKLIRDGLLSKIETSLGLIGYRFSGVLLDAYNKVDQTLRMVLSSVVEPEAHSCTSTIPRDILDRIQFFNSLPSIPFHVIPHGVKDCDLGAGWILSPSTCYHTFSFLEGRDVGSELKAFTAAGACHRFEPLKREPTRLANFTMRELVLFGKQAEVERAADRIFELCRRLLLELTADVELVAASDVFYGQNSAVARKAQYAMGVKKEMVIPWTDGSAVSVGSRNYHGDLFTRAFDIRCNSMSGPPSSACVAFGVERLLLTLLANTKTSPSELVAKLARASETVLAAAQAKRHAESDDMQNALRS